MEPTHQSEPMITLSAFADEISDRPEEQVDVLAANGVHHIEFRAIHTANVLDLSDEQLRDFKRLLDARGFGLSAIGSPIGKIKITDPFEPHLERFHRAIALAKRFGTPNIRIFSYYMPDGTIPDEFRGEVLARMREKVSLAEQAGVTLLHENEKGIYGDTGERCLDLVQSIDRPSFRNIWDPANYLHAGEEPYRCWRMLKDYTAHLHIKDYDPVAKRHTPAGQGAGRIPEVLKEAVEAGYSGFAVLEPHLAIAESMRGFTGPDLFADAVSALKGILDRIGAAYS